MVLAPGSGNLILCTVIIGNIYSAVIFSQYFEVVHTIIIPVLQTEVLSHRKIEHLASGRVGIQHGIWLKGPSSQLLCYRAHRVTHSIAPMDSYSHRSNLLELSRAPYSQHQLLTTSGVFLTYP